MELYYHKTDGGAEYYSIKRGGRGFMRTDGNEIEIFPDRLEKGGPRLIVHGAAFLTERELELMSLGILDLIRDACEAEKLLPVSDAKSGIYRYRMELQALNTKICTMEARKDD